MKDITIEFVGAIRFVLGFGISLIGNLICLMIYGLVYIAKRVIEAGLWVAGCTYCGGGKWTYRETEFHIGE